MFQQNIKPQPDPQQNVGILDLRLVRAELFRDTEIIGQVQNKRQNFQRKMDPYVSIEYSGQKFRSATQKDAGKHPVWDQLFQMQVINLNDELMIKVYDENLGTDDLIGMAIIKVSQLCQNKGFQEQCFTLMFKDKQAGKILLESRYSNNQPPFQGMPLQSQGISTQQVPLPSQAFAGSAYEQQKFQYNPTTGQQQQPQFYQTAYDPNNPLQQQQQNPALSKNVPYQSNLPQQQQQIYRDQQF
ncbi:c2 domain containing protein [Stylonychia lemnae]|uniref:C2 domain containing protein n=1 Tax=Stylonychia lemnae TaxID=5949 RepID=A0A078B4Y9_STYLE|nr:c2 domain containing protein [Stylonychia lemnae]|eukprot:CDW88292.1 c2 domain containing protein [Stylonychia lemnae]